MSKIVLFTDSTCDLSKDIIKKLNIQIVPLYVNFNEDAFKDGVEMDALRLFQEVKERGMLPKSSCPTFADFYIPFKKYLDEGYDIFYTGIGSGFSGTLNVVKNVKEELKADNIYVLDSENLSTGIGYLLLKANDLAQDGKSGQEILDILNVEKKKIRCQFSINTFEYLHKGGRCSGMTSLVGTILSIKPNIKVVNNEMIVARKIIGLSRSMKAQINDIVAEIENNNIDLNDYIFVTVSEGDKYQERVYDEIVKLGFTKVIKTKAGCVISTHCGKAAFGTIYKLKN